MPDPIEDDHRTVRFATHLAEVHEVAKIDLADHAAVWYTRHESAAMVQEFLGSPRNNTRGSRFTRALWNVWCGFVVVFLVVLLLTLHSCHSSQVSLILSEEDEQCRWFHLDTSKDK